MRCWWTRLYNNNTFYNIVWYCKRKRFSSIIIIIYTMRVLILIWKMYVKLWRVGISLLVLIHCGTISVYLIHKRSKLRTLPQLVCGNASLCLPYTLFRALFFKKFIYYCMPKKKLISADEIILIEFYWKWENNY